MEHVGLSPGSPDQLCLVCHGPDQGDAPDLPHALDAQRHHGCTRCHGPRREPRPRPLL